MAGGDGSQAAWRLLPPSTTCPLLRPAGPRNRSPLTSGLTGATSPEHSTLRMGTEHRVDLARVNGRVFVNNASMGFYGKLVQSQAYRVRSPDAIEVLPQLVGQEADLRPPLHRP